MQYSNGLTHPAGLWLGHLLFDGISGIAIATIVTVVFAAVMPQQFHGLGYLVSHILSARFLPKIPCRSGLLWHCTVLQEPSSHIVSP